MLAMRVAAPFISLRVAYHNCPLEAHRISGNVICKVTVYYLNWSIWLLLLVIPFKIHPQILWNCPPPDPNTPRTLIPFVSGTVVTRNVAWATSWTTKGIFAERNRISHTVPPPTRKVTASFRLVIHHEGRFHTGALKQVRRELLPGLKIRTRQGNLSVFPQAFLGWGQPGLKLVSEFQSMLDLVTPAAGPGMSFLCCPSQMEAGSTSCQAYPRASCWALSRWQ